MTIPISAIEIMRLRLTPAAFQRGVSLAATFVGDEAIAGGWLLVIVADAAIVPFVPASRVVPVLGLGTTFGLTVSAVALLKDGRVLNHQTMAAKGSSENPLTPAEETEKALDLIVPILGKKRSTALLDTLWHFDRIPDVRALRKLYTA